MFRSSFISLFLVILLQSSHSLALEFSNDSSFQIYTREKTSLNGEWKIIVDPYENGYYNYRYEAFDKQSNPPPSAYFNDAKMQSPSELLEYDFDLADSLQVPGDWNTQDEKYYYYEGTIWYRKQFPTPSKAKNDRVFLNFAGVNYQADVYLNGKKLGRHVGGFTPFAYEVTQFLKAKTNSLVVKVDNKRHASAVPTLNTDWWNYGGITRDVDLVVVPKTFIRDYNLKYQAQEKQIQLSVQLDGAKPKQKVTVAFPELGIEKRVKTNADGLASFVISAPKALSWSPEQPQLYRLNIRSQGDQLNDRVGLRSIRTKDKDILLNGESIFLRGISIHEEYAIDGGGRVKSEEQARKLLQLAKDMNCNFVRLAHYPHNEHIVRIADEIGMLVWSEIPVYWTIDWTNESTYQNAEDQLSAMIQRDKNRASIIIWSLANETPVSEARNTFLSRLAKTARKIDNTRLISAAMEKHGSPSDPRLAIVEDPLADIVDVVSFNQYIGWYDGLPDKIDRAHWHIPYNKPVFISEFGGGARYGLHGDVNERWTEEYQEAIYEKTFKMLDKIDGFRGTSPWILMDFRSPRRPHKTIQNDFNRKGLLSEKSEKKKAYFVVKKYYQSKM